MIRRCLTNKVGTRWMSNKQIDLSEEELFHRKTEAKYEAQQDATDREYREQETRDALRSQPEKIKSGETFVRSESTKMTVDSVLCPQNEELVASLRQYADLQRRRGNIEIYEGYTLPAGGIIDNIRKQIAPVIDSRGMRFRFVSIACRQDFEQRLKDIKNFGRITDLDEDPAITARKLFHCIPGLMHKADNYVSRGYRTIDDLLSSPDAKEWSVAQHREVQYFEHFRSRIQCQEAVLMSLLLQDHIHELDRDIQFAETGSVRRRELWTREHDIRFLITKEGVDPRDGQQQLQKVVNHLLQAVNGGREWEIWNQGHNSILLKARIPAVFTETRWRKLYITYVDYNEWVPQLIETTGHSVFLDRFTDRLKEKNWELTSTAIYDPDHNLRIFNTEEAFFNTVGEPFIPPWDRTEQGPQLNRRNNDYTFVAGEYREKPRAHRAKSYRGRRLTYHELLQKKEAAPNAPSLKKDFDFKATLFEKGFNSDDMQRRVDS
eukprot:TRINITY_DN2417_c0_g1_i1.p1 TRINITY_DN2417_c0_g1~~TRINITY_DN2417_c0_g1_i1.p1  ORF type:complete len:491 (+),score=82.48 TRINITY_DN2417_c0_g1_i1:44-1516(+)